MTPAKRQPRDELLVCHHGLTALALVNPTRMPTVRVARRSRTGAWGPRSGPEAELLPVKPACSLALRRRGTLNRPYHAVACPQAPPARRCPCRRMVMLALTCKPLSSSTTDTRGPSLARSFVEQKASQSLPASSSPGPEPAWPSPPRRPPRGSLSWCMCLRPSPALWLGALGSVSRPSIDRPGTRCRFPIPPSPELACFTPPAVVLALMGSLLVSAQTPDTALDFRSRGGPMRADGAANSRIDPPAGARPDLATDEAAASKAVARHNPPWLQKCTDGAGAHVHF